MFKTNFYREGMFLYICPISPSYIFCTGEGAEETPLLCLSVILLARSSNINMPAYTGPFFPKKGIWPHMFSTFLPSLVFLILTVLVTLVFAALVVACPSETWQSHVCHARLRFWRLNLTLSSRIGTLVTRDPADPTGELWDGDGLGLLPSFFGPPVTSSHSLDICFGTSHREVFSKWWLGLGYCWISTLMDIDGYLWILIWYWWILMDVANYHSKNLCNHFSRC